MAGRTSPRPLLPFAATHLIVWLRNDKLSSSVRSCCIPGILSFGLDMGVLCAMLRFRMRCILVQYEMIPTDAFQMISASMLSLVFRDGFDSNELFNKFQHYSSFQNISEYFFTYFLCVRPHYLCSYAVADVTLSSQTVSAHETPSSLSVAELLHERVFGALAGSQQRSLLR